MLFLAAALLAVFAAQSVLDISESGEAAWNTKLIGLGAVNTILLFWLIVDYGKNKRYIPYVLALYISQTGFTYDIKPGYQTSVNEAFTFAILILWMLRKSAGNIHLSSAEPRPYFSKYMNVFLMISVGGIFTAYLVFHVLPLNIFIISKSYMLYLFYLYLIPDCVRSEEELHNILVFMLLLSLVPLYYAVTGSMAIVNIEYARLSVSGWGALNIFVGYIMPIFFIAFGLMLYEKKVLKKLVIMIYMGIIVYVLILAQTRTGWGGLIAGTGLLIFITNRKLISIAVSIVLVIGLMFSPYGEHIKQTITKRIVEQTLNPDHALRERYSRWDAAWFTGRAYPLTGSGWGALLPIHRDGTVGDESTTLLPLWHSAYLELLSQLGFPGLFAFILFWSKIVRVEGARFFRPKRSPQSTYNVGIFVGVITCLIYAFAEQQFYRIETASHTYFLAGLLLASSRFLNAQKAEKELNPQE
jgi:O-antigen ligase